MPDFFSATAGLLLFALPPTQAHYPAPSSFEAHEAFNDLVTEFVTSARGHDAGRIDTTPNWAVDFSLHRCLWGQEGQINPIEYGLPHNYGYFCQFSVQPYGESGFATMGFFTHDGVQWRYLGLVQETDELGGGDLPTHKQVKTQPYVSTPYLAGRAYDYQFREGVVADTTPYAGDFEGYFAENPYNPTASNSDDVIINAFERDDYRNRRYYDDWIRFPKGTEKRNRTGY